MKHVRYFAIVLSLVTLGACMLPGRVHADTASLYLAPASATVNTGDNFTVNLGLNPNGNSVNAIEATVNFPGVLAITGAGTGGSLCSIWVQQPTVSGSSVSFKCGIPGGTTSNGNLISVSLRGNSVGSGNATITAARVLAGPGVNVTGGTSGGTYTVNAAPAGGSSKPPASNAPAKAANPITAAPSVSSSSHPNQDAWYKDPNVALSWNQPSGVTGYSTVFDQAPDTTPGGSANLSAASTSFAKVTDGTWYFHIRANSAAGWSSTTSYRVQIDAAAPTGLTIVTEPKLIADKRPMISFAATDATSGVDHYEIRLNKDAFKTAASPYTPSTITAGVNTITVRAYDKAGNMTEGTATITIKPVGVPKIISPTNNTILKLIQKLEIKGTASPATTVDLFYDGTNIARAVLVGRDGTWSYTYKQFMLPGKHKITAVAVKDDILSQTSPATTITIDPSAVTLFSITFPIIVIIIALITIIALLVMLLAWLAIFIRNRNRATAKIVNKRLGEAGNDLRKDVRTLNAKDGLPRKFEKQLDAKIDGEIKTAKQAIDQDLRKPRL